MMTQDTDLPIKIWQFDGAPREWRESGGSESSVPPSLWEEEFHREFGGKKILSPDTRPPSRTEYKALSSHGGDEDWIIYSPPGLDPDIAESIAEKLEICERVGGGIIPPEMGGDERFGVEEYHRAGSTDRRFYPPTPPPKLSS